MNILLVKLLWRKQGQIEGQFPLLLDNIHIPIL